MIWLTSSAACCCCCCLAPAAAAASWSLLPLLLLPSVPPLHQVVLPGPWSNLTLFSLVLENLPFGDAGSVAEAEGNSILLSNWLWPISYQR